MQRIVNGHNVRFDAVERWNARQVKRALCRLESMSVPLWEIETDIDYYREWAKWVVRYTLERKPKGGA
jgi:hypothetical protein